MSAPFIVLKAASKVYRRDAVAVYALNQLNLTIQRGAFVVVLGPSGCGKSTLLNLLGGLDQPTEGQVLVDEQDISHYSDAKLTSYRREKVGFVFQFFNLHPLLTAVENVEFPETIANKPPKERREKALALLKLVGLEARANHYPNQLSGGEQQRVAIARALINDPEIIMADEPTGNLDTHSGHEIMKLLVSLKKKSTIIVITHDIDIAKHADHVIKIRDGKVEYADGFRKKLL